MPVAPAAAKRISCLRSLRRRMCGLRMQRAQKPIANLMSRIQRGERLASSTFVDTNVVPHTNTVKSATRWYFTGDIPSRRPQYSSILLLASSYCIHGDAVALERDRIFEHVGVFCHRAFSRKGAHFSSWLHYVL